MPNFVYKISDESFDLLKKLDAVQVWGEDQDDTSEVEPPKDLLDAEKPKLIKKLREEVEDEIDELDEDSIKFVLCLGRTQDKVEEFLTGDNPDSLFIKSKQLGPVEVNGLKGKYFVFFSAIS